MGPLRETIPLLSHAKTWRLFVSIFAGCLKFKHLLFQLFKLLWQLDIFRGCTKRSGGKQFITIKADNLPKDC